MKHILEISLCTAVLFFGVAVANPYKELEDDIEELQLEYNQNQVIKI